jgi:3-hydroxy-9,10-secoandrosta-1,3,5(10)-triene-9,17-dione monooxygenase
MLEPFTEEERASLMRDRAYIMKLCRQSCERLVTMMGAQGLFNTNPVQRAFRDLHAMATQFGVNWDLNMPPYGRLALGLPSGAR